ncbi:hypothetical protein [Arthrobacter sp. B1I2]|uniref:hypothetical protein n=1 Tax=Arthrobacter sp. B1I2 TaxID=3042263 RepID=UPI0027882804|nr:hypothetical protein [Arthrobacter sp. B1I2]MDQ0732433.1 hypothetical protein [Arthrobacter sp. B1I2]
MKIQEWRPLVTDETRNWLIAHNGEPLNPQVSADILVATRGATEPEWWAGDSADGHQLTDAATDWIETIANGEDPAPII